MDILVTGVTGYIGSAVAAALLDAGHRVTGTGRDAAKARALEARGLAFRKVELADVAALSAAARGADAVIHAASDTTPKRAEVEHGAVKALLAGAREGARAFVYTSGIWVLGATGEKAADEAAAAHPIPLVGWRPSVEAEVLAGKTSTLRTFVLRPGVVYGGKSGILSQWWSSALEKKAFQIVGEGTNRWPMVHREDLAALYRTLVEKAPAPGVFHGTDDSALTVAAMAGAVAQQTGASFARWPYAEARAKLGPYAEALALDQWVTSPASRALGWKPKRPDFASAAASALDEFRA